MRWVVGESGDNAWCWVIHESTVLDPAAGLRYV